MKRQLFYLFSTIIMVFSLFACNNEDKEKEEQEVPQRDVSIQVTTNPSDPKIARITTINKDTIFIFGEKDELNNPVHIRELIVKSENEGVTEFSFNDQDQLSLIKVSNGVTFELEWISETQVVLIATEPENGEQLNTLIDLNQEPEKAGLLKVNTTAQKRIGILSMSLKPIQDIEINSLNVQTKSYTQKAYINIKQCNVLSDAQCYVDVYEYGGGSFINRLHAKRVSTGVYEIDVPYGMNPAVIGKVPEYCKNLSKALELVCIGNEGLGIVGKQLLCLQLSAALASGIISVPAAAWFEAACALGSASADLYCYTIGYSPVPGAPSIMDGLCEVLEDVNDNYKLAISLYPKVHALPTDIWGSPVVLKDGYTSIPNMLVSYGNETKINSFVLDPSAPLEGISYKAIAKINCLPFASKVKMSIVGTDGYTNSITQTISSTEAHYEAVLSVPGAEKGVKDVCTIEVFDSAGFLVVKKQASLVFK